jgi:hypothetical protein
VSTTDAVIVTAQIITTLVIAGTFFVSIRQLRTMHQESTAGNLSTLIKLLQDPEVVRARGIVLRELPTFEPPVEEESTRPSRKSWGDEEHQAAGLVTKSYAWSS